MTDSANGISLPPDCPPAGHLPADGRFYRLANPKHEVGDATIHQDWRLPLDTPKGQGYQRYDLCEAYAISLFGDLDTLVSAREAVPFARRKSIAQIDLEHSMGRILETESFAPTHHDWWPTEGLNPTGVVIQKALES